MLVFAMLDLVINLWQSKAGGVRGEYMTIY